MTSTPRSSPRATTLPDNLRTLFERLEVPPQDWRRQSGEVIAFAHSLTVPAGVHVRQPLRLTDSQLDFLRRVYNPRQADGRRAVRQGVYSVGRRNGKTLLAAVMVLAHLAGPLKRPNSRIVSAATTRKQATLVFQYVSDIVRAAPFLARHVKVLESVKRAVHLADGSSYEAIAAEAGSQFGQGLDLCIYDELAQAKNRTLYDALMTSLGSQSEPLMVVISTQAPGDAHLLSELIDYGEQVEAGIIDDPAFTVQLHAAPADCDLMDREAWKAANPGLGDYRDETELRTTLQRAIRLPSLENSIRNLYLNQRVRAHASFLSRSVWEANAGEVDRSIFTDGRPVYGGLDLSERTDLTALVLAAAGDDGAVHLWPTAWTPGDTLDDRATRDRAPYDGWARQGLLEVVPGQVIDYDFVAATLGERTAGMNLAKIHFDRWRIDIMRQALARQGLRPPLVDFGQGYKSMSPALEAFEELALAGKLRHGSNPLLWWCMSNAVVEADAARSRKLVKAKSIGRIDLAIAAVMAVAAMKVDPAPVLDVSAMIA